MCWPDCDSQRRFNTQPPEGGWVNRYRKQSARRCFNTQPPEGGWIAHFFERLLCFMFQHTAARRRLANSLALSNSGKMFQHTAARRRLV